MLLKETTSLCKDCKRPVPAQVLHEGNEVVMRKSCVEHGDQAALVSSNYEWYARALEQPASLEAPTVVTKQVDAGCPLDCGACTDHEQRVHLPVVPITSACNLDCPICYTHNKNENAYHMSREEMAAILDKLAVAAPDKRIINITGGEPTQHPYFLDLLQMCQDAGIRRITLSTHGMHLLKAPEMLTRLAELKVRVILSFDSFKDEVNASMLGGNFTDAKMRVLELLESHDIATSLLPVLGRGYNNDEVGDFVKLALRKDFIRSVEFHPMTFTGQSGASFDRASRYTTYDALVDLEKHSEGALRVDDFVSSPAAHPLCYSVSYLLRLADGRWLPFLRFMKAQELRAMLAGRLYLEPSPEMESSMRDVVNRIWADELPDAQLILDSLAEIARGMFDPASSYEQRMAAAERDMKAVYMHTHMDEETFDVERIKQCCVGMPSSDGSNIPSCAYNVLYRERDARFVEQPQPAVKTLASSRLRVV